MSFSWLTFTENKLLFLFFKVWQTRKFWVNWSGVSDTLSLTSVQWSCMTRSFWSAGTRMLTPDPRLSSYTATWLITMYPKRKNMWRVNATMLYCVVVYLYRTRSYDTVVVHEFSCNNSSSLTVYLVICMSQTVQHIKYAHKIKMFHIIFFFWINLSIQLLNIPWINNTCS